MGKVQIVFLYGVRDIKQVPVILYVRLYPAPLICQTDINSLSVYA